MTEAELQACLDEGKANAGAVQAQIDSFVKEVAATSDLAGADTYQPGSIL